MSYIERQKTNARKCYLFLLATQKSAIGLYPHPLRTMVQLKHRNFCILIGLNMRQSLPIIFVAISIWIQQFHEEFSANTSSCLKDNIYWALLAFSFMLILSFLFFQLYKLLGLQCDLSTDAWFRPAIAKCINFFPSPFPPAGYVLGCLRLKILEIP